MDSVIIIGGVLAVIALGAFFSRRSSPWLDMLEAIAREHRGLRVFTEHDGHTLVGKVRGVPVRVWTYAGEHQYTKVEVDSGLPRWLHVGRSRAAAGGAVGDPEFDRVAQVRSGDPAKVVAALDALTRGALGYAVDEHEAELAEGALSITIIGRPRREKLSRMIDAAVNVGYAARRAKGSIDARLERTATHDPVPSVRRRAFELLRERVGRRGVAAAAARLLRSPVPELVLLAAGTLRDAAAVAGLNALVRRPVVDHRERALDLLCELGHPPSEPDALGFASEADPLIRAAAARCLGVLGTEGAHARLVELLGDEEDVAVTAAHVLGDHGDLDAVEPLLAVAEGRGPTALRHAARDAVAAIQERRAGEAGRLSLFAPDAGDGALSLAAHDHAETEP